MSTSLRPREVLPLIKTRLPLLASEFYVKNDEKFSSERGFIISTCAASVGLGNVVRFPYIVYKLGGATYIFAQIVTLICVAFPFMFLETAAGRLAQGNVVSTYRFTNKRLGPIHGWAVILLTFAITSYLMVITGWTLAFSFDAVANRLVVFDDFCQGFKSLYWFITLTVLCALIMLKGVKALEKLCTVLIPVLMALLLMLVVVSALTTGEGWEKTKDFVFRVNWSDLADVDLWFFAFGQAFFTIAIGQGYLETYGSLLPPKIHIPRASIIVGLTQLSVSLASIFVIFPFVFASDEKPAAGLELAFNVLPKIFPSLKGGYVLSIAFFFLFFLAAFSSSLAGFKVILNAVSEEFSISNKTAVIIVTCLLLIAGTPSALSSTSVKLTINGESFMDFIDRFTGTTAVILTGVIGSVLVCTAVRRKDMRRALGVTWRGWDVIIYFISSLTPVLLVCYFVYRYIY
ncbi:hypothetical protein GEMRC1_006111 [Eukaryota sp. GEM-RC1]